MPGDLQYTIFGVGGGEVVDLAIKVVRAYTRRDKMIWTLFLAFRKFDRWMTTKIFRKRYEFILPGKIKR